MEKKKFSLFAWMQKIPDGIILVPLFIGIFMNTFFPQALQIGGFPTGMFKTGTGCLLGLFLMRISLTSLISASVCWFGWL